MKNRTMLLTVAALTLGGLMSCGGQANKAVRTENKEIFTAEDHIDAKQTKAINNARQFVSAKNFNNARCVTNENLEDVALCEIFLNNVASHNKETLVCSTTDQGKCLKVETGKLD